MTADPFVDFRAMLDEMPADQQVAAVGASTYRLIREGVIPWDEAVTQSRVRTLEEIVARRKLSVDRMVKAGVRSDRAERAYSAVHTPEHEIVNAHRRQLVANLRTAGLSGAQIKQAFGERIAAKVSLGGKVGRPGAIGKSVTPIDVLAPSIFLGLGLNSKAKAALQQAKPEKVELPEYGPSEAEVVGSGGKPEELEAALKRASEILGRDVTAKDLASIAGAPDNIRVIVAATKSGVRIVLSGPGIRDGVRRLRVGEDGKPELKNDVLEVTSKGHGLGSEILGRQIENAARLGIARMKTNAAGNPELASLPEGAIVGFKVWPKFGYDGPLSDEQRAALPEKFRGTRTIGELYRTKEGRDAWAEFGSDIDLTFDLGPDSYSQHVWRAYREEKARDAKRKQQD